jgi:hypothetical protein
MAKSNPNLTRLLISMKKLISEVNDQEICRRLEILINSDHDDLSAGLARQIFEESGNLEPKMIPEPFTQYVMHYLFMVKREARKHAKIAQARLNPPVAAKKKVIKKKAI